MVHSVVHRFGLIAAAAATSVCIVLSGCERGPPPDPSTFTVRDSAGITIVESVAPAWAAEEAWTVTPDPSLHIGVVDGAPEYQFSIIAGVWRRADGTIVVADARAAEVRSYDPQGTFIGEFGGRGEGPGEFLSIALAQPYLADSTVVFSRGRISVFDRDDVLGRSLVVDLPSPEPMQAPGVRAYVFAGSLSGAFSDGTFLFAAPTMWAGVPGERVSVSSPYVRLSAAGGQLGTAGTLTWMTVVPGGSSLDPFSSSAAPVVDGVRLYMPMVQGFEITHVGVGGEVERVLRSTHVDLTVTEAAREAYREFQRQLPRGQSDPQATERALAEVVFPEQMPAHSQMLVDGSDHLWVRHYRPPYATGPETWSVFHPDGHLLGTVQTPERLDIRQIGSDFILGIWTDELDVRFIRMHPLDRRN